MARKRGSIVIACLCLGACADVAPAPYAPGPLAIPDAGASGANDGGDANDASGGNEASRDASTDAAPPSHPWEADVLYLVVPDRFANGDPSNDAAGNAGCFDPADPSKSHGGDLAGIRKRIPYLEELGATAVWILPQYKEAPGRCGYHGYWADFADPDDGAIEPTMGTAADLTGLAGDLHAAGMRFVLDMVVNHAGRSARVVAQHPDWFHDPATCASLGDPAVYCPIGGMPLPDFAQEKAEVAAYLTQMCASWAARFGVDGIRMDTVKNVGVPYWKTWTLAMIAQKSNLFLLGEVFDEGAAANLVPYVDAGFTSLFNYPLYGALVATFANDASVNGVADKLNEEIGALGMPRVRRLVTFVDNHDNVRFTSAIPAAASGDDRAQRMRLALGAIFTLPGIPQLYYGDELALYGAKDPDNRRDMPAWAWSAADRAGTHGGAVAADAGATFAYVKKLVAMRTAHAALSLGDYAEIARQNGSANVLAFLRATKDERIVVVLNAGPATSVALPTAVLDGATLDDLAGEGAPSLVTIAKGTLSLSLPAHALGVYRVR